ncbi:MAG: hypothetical protein KDK40_02215 [Chlamydiia bacterium]|nr:hypothetical protein [Chlamydiia bacterium]
MDGLINGVTGQIESHYEGILELTNSHAKAVKGAALIASGLALIQVSHLPKALTSRVWSKKEENESPNPIALTVKNCLLAASGVIVTCCGIYTLTAAFSDPLPTPPPPPPPQPPAHTCEARLAQAKTTFFSCPPAKKLWDEVDQEGAFTITCMPAETAPTKAMTWLETREILISSGNTEMLSPLLFELNNLKRAKVGILLSQNKCTFENADAYAKLIERLEYGTTKDTHEMATHCVDNGYWPVNSLNYREEFAGNSKDSNWNTFEGYLKTQEKYGHTDFYRSKWYKACDPGSRDQWIAKNIDRWKAVLAESSKNN